MNEIINKISSYKIFNYLIPGAIFVFLLKYMTSFDLTQEDTLVGLILYYFVGMIISRIGSLVIEPIFKKCRFIVFEPYEDYCMAREKDALISELQEEGNSYRTFIAVFFTLLLSIGVEKLVSLLNVSSDCLYLLIVILFMILFGVGYCKQLRYIVKRIKKAKGDK